MRLIRKTRIPVRLLPLSLLLLIGCKASPDATVRLDRVWKHSVDSAVMALLSSSRTPGAVVAVVEGGAVAFSSGYGAADLSTGEPMTDTTVINIASLSKPVATWGLFRLIETRGLGLDVPVADQLHRWRLPPSAFDPSQVTVRRLLSHTAGLGMAAVPWFRADSARPSLEEVLGGRAGERGPVSIEKAPGGGWAYSGGGFTVLELLIEEKSGQSFEEFMQREVFGPLGLTRSTFAPAERGLQLGAQYADDGSAVPTYRYVGEAAGGLYTCARDFARLLIAYGRAARDSLEPRVLSAKAITAMATPVAPVVLDGKELPDARYGLGHGTFPTSDGDTLLYHSGGNPGTRAYFIVSLRRGIGLFIATNSDNGVPVIEAVRRLWGVHYRLELPPLY